MAAATIAYAVAARATVAEMQLTRAESIRPVLVLTPEFLGVNFAIARLSNIGLGAARDIRGTIRRSDNDVAPRQDELRIAMMLPKAQHEFFVDIDKEEQHHAQTVQEMAARDRKVSVDLRYEDPVGRAYSLAAEVGWRDTVERFWPVGIRRQPDLLADAVDELKKLREAVEKNRGIIERLR